MAVTRRWTVEQKRAHVVAYLSVPKRAKMAYLAEHDLSTSHIRQWRTQIFTGLLEQGLIVRGGVGLIHADENREFVRLVRENEQLQAELVAARAEHARALADKDEQIAVQGRAVDALGKAIGLLQPGTAGQGQATAPTPSASVTAPQQRSTGRA